MTKEIVRLPGDPLICRICEREFKPRVIVAYVCCNGYECGCRGETLDREVCSVDCHEEMLARMNEENSPVRREDIT